MVWPPVFEIFNERTDADAGDCTRGQRHGQDSAVGLRVDPRLPASDGQAAPLVWTPETLSIYSDRVADVTIMSQGRDFGNSANLETTGMRIAFFFFFFFLGGGGWVFVCFFVAVVLFVCCCYCCCCLFYIYLFVCVCVIIF